MNREISKRAELKMSNASPNPSFADRMVTLLTQGGLRPSDLASRAGVSQEVVEACLKGEEVRSSASREGQAALTSSVPLWNRLPTRAGT